jgi:Flp pilus assembly protein TadG
MRRSRMRLRPTDRGAAAVEFALVLPILMALVCGIVDFGRAFNAQLTVTHAARESVRVWALGGSQTDATARAEAAAVPLTVTVVYSSTGDCTFGSTARVTVRTSFAYIFPGFTDLVPGAGTLSSDGVMRCGG